MSKKAVRSITIAAALFAVHPVHVEAVANVAGQSELFVALLVVVALGLYVRSRASGALTPLRWIVIGALFAAACLFKEHAIVLPVLIVVAEMTVVRDRDPLTSRLTRSRGPLLALALIAVAFLVTSLNHRTYPMWSVVRKDSRARVARV